MKKSITAILVEQYGMTVEEIAVTVKASASAVRNWKHGQEPRPVYRAILAGLLETKKKEAA